MSHDFSQQPDLRSLGQVARALQAVAEPAGVNFLLVGATARDLMLRYAHGIEPARQTADVDFAVMVNSWPTFEALRQALIAGGEFSSRPADRFHQLRHATGLPVDIVPFGGIERANRTIAWPPDESTVLDCFGAREAFEASTWVLLPGGAKVRVASIPALALLKIMSWHDRKRTYPGKDAPDLVLYLRTYMDCGNLDRAASEHADLFEVEDFDHVESGARLLARDIARLMDRSAIERLLSILMPEADENGALLFASQSGIALEDARRLVEVFCDEFVTT